MPSRITYDLQLLSSAPPYTFIFATSLMFFTYDSLIHSCSHSEQRIRMSIPPYFPVEYSFIQRDSLFLSDVLVHER